MNFKKVLLSILISIIAILAIWIIYKLVIVKDYILSDSEGFCTMDSQCGHIDPCGGGHGKCENNPDKFAVGICDIDLEHPSMKGYECGCIELIGRCGWKK